MWTLSGAAVWPPGDPQGDEGFPSLTDIGVGLGRMPRFGGMVKEWYPVLAHTFTVASLVPVAARPYALLHDAPEALLGDTPSPWKSPGMNEREEHLLARIIRGNELTYPVPEDIWKDVKTADAIALAAEAKVLGFPKPDWFIENYFPDYHNDERVKSVIDYAQTETTRRLQSCRDFLVHGFAGAYFKRGFLSAMEEIKA